MRSPSMPSAFKRAFLFFMCERRACALRFWWYCCLLNSVSRRSVFVSRSAVDSGELHVGKTAEIIRRRSCFARQPEVYFFPANLIVRTGIIGPWRDRNDSPPMPPK